MGQKYNNSITFRALYKGLKICCRNVRWKDSVIGYEANALKNTYRLRKSLLDGSYKIDPYQRFYVMEPKKRLIVATRIKDRQFQRALCDGLLYPELTRHFIYDNSACMRGKGVDFALDRMECHLQRFWREERAKAPKVDGFAPSPFHAGGWALCCDVRHFFDSTPHDVSKAAIAARVRDAEAIRRNGQIIDSFGGDTGTGLGSQASQLNQLAVLDDLDHMIKEQLHIAHYLRYMDDFVLIHADRDVLEACLDAIREHMAARGLTLNAKTCIVPITQGVKFLKWRFLLLDTGKVVRKMARAKITKERRKLRKLRGLLDAGRITMAEVRANYAGWLNNALRGNTRNLILAMNDYYREIFKEEPPNGNCHQRHHGPGPRGPRAGDRSSPAGGQSGKGLSGSAGT